MTARLRYFFRPNAYMRFPERKD